MHAVWTHRYWRRGRPRMFACHVAVVKQCARIVKARPVLPDGSLGALRHIRRDELDLDPTRRG